MNFGQAYRGGAQTESEFLPRFFDLTAAGTCFSNGCTSTALSANTITLSATTTPVLGVWNPPTSGVNVVLTQALLQITNTAVSAVGQGAFVWANSTGNTSISTGSTPTNRLLGSSTASAVKGMSFQALTGLTNNLVVFDAADFSGLVAPQGATQTPIMGQIEIQNFDGNLIVQPGGVLALLNTVSTITVSVAGSLRWFEAPLS